MVQLQAQNVTGCTQRVKNWLRLKKRRKTAYFLLHESGFHDFVRQTVDIRSKLGEANKTVFFTFGQKVGGVSANPKNPYQKMLRFFDHF